MIEANPKRVVCNKQSPTFKFCSNGRKRTKTLLLNLQYNIYFNYTSTAHYETMQYH